MAVNSTQAGFVKAAAAPGLTVDAAAFLLATGFVAVNEGVDEDVDDRTVEVTESAAAGALGVTEAWATANDETLAAIRKTTRYFMD